MSVASTEFSQLGDDGDRLITRDKSRRRSLNDTELVTFWGVIAAKLLHSQVLDFSLLTDSVMYRRRLEARAKSGRVLYSVRERAFLVLLQAKEMALRIAD